MIRYKWLIAMVVCSIGAASGANAGTDKASATLKDQSGKEVGHVVLEETPHGVLVRSHFSGLPAGTHAFHVHEAGKCQPPFESAGGHFNPGDEGHGFVDDDGVHAGDLPNVHIPESGELQVELLARDLTLRDGERSVFDENGSALVVHAKADDYKSEPAGNAGDRIACGVIERQ